MFGWVLNTQMFKWLPCKILLSDLNKIVQVNNLQNGINQCRTYSLIDFNVSQGSELLTLL